MNTGTSAVSVTLHGLPVRGLPGHAVAAYLTSEADSLAPVAGPRTAPEKSVIPGIASRLAIMVNHC